MGEVYRARDTKLGRDIALKILPEFFAKDPDRLMRFEREAKTLASLNHPHIAQLYGFEESSGTRALVMELVEGEDLSQRIGRGPVPLDEALGIARHIADALEAAHEAGVVHRDLKPANVKVRPDGTVKVLDFGLAKDAARDGVEDFARTFTSPAMTAAGVILGTAAYMSPEQARGRPVDKRADIWAFGCVLYEMLTGRPPFPGDTITDVIAAVVKNEPDWTALPAETPPRIRLLLARCLQKDPRMRLRDIGDARLEIVEREPIAPVRSGDRRPPAVLILAIGTAVTLALGIAAGAWWRSSAAIPTPEWDATRLGGPSTVMHPVLSPDGQFVAFQTIVDGQSQLAVMNSAGGTWRVVTTDRSRGLILLHDWAPDGSRIFYDRQTDTLNGIFAVPALGGDERLVLENAGHPTTLPDGDLLVLRVNANRRTQLHRFSPSTGSVDPLPALIDTNTTDDAVASSRDGRRVYFFGRPPNDTSPVDAVYELDLQNKQTRPIGIVNLRHPVSIARHPGSDDIIAGGVDGDAFRILRFTPSTAAAPRTVLLVPGLSRFDVAADGTVYLGLRNRPPELFAFRAGPSTPAAPERLAGSSVANTRFLQTLAPLPDGGVLIGAREGDRDRLLVVRAGRQPVVLVDGDEETRPPATAVGLRQAAIMMGRLASPDVAIVSTSDGRIVRRFKAPSAEMTGLAASPDGATLYYTAAGSVWALPAAGGEPRKLGAGDSATVDPDTGDLIVKLDEGERMRLVRMNGASGAAVPIEVRGDLRLIPRPLMPGAVRQGRLVLGVTSMDSWFWHAATVDLKTGMVRKLVDQNPSDFHFLTWSAGGDAIGYGFGLDTSLWRFTPRK